MMLRTISRLLILFVACLSPMKLAALPDEIVHAQVDAEMEGFVDDIAEGYVSSRSIALQTITVGGLILVAGLVAYLLIDNAHTHTHIHSH